MTKSDTITNLATALNKAQADMPVAAFDATNPFLKNKYATLGAIIECSKEVLSKNGLSVVQMPFSEQDRIGVETMLCHESGEWVAERISLPIGEEKGKSLAQVSGSILTYLRRYALSAFVKVYADEDTDGHGHEPKAYVPPAGVTTATEHFKNKPTEAFDYEKFRDRMLSNLMAVIDQAELKEFAVKSGILNETDALLAWPCEHVPKTKDQMNALIERIKSFVAGVPLDAMPPVQTQPAASQQAEWPTEELPTSAGWKEVVHPIKKLKLGDMEEKDIRWWHGAFKVTSSYEKDGKTINKKPESIAKDQAFRKALDEAGRFFGW